MSNAVEQIAKDVGAKLAEPLPPRAMVAFRDNGEGRLEFELANGEIICMLAEREIPPELRVQHKKLFDDHRHCYEEICRLIPEARQFKRLPPKIWFRRTTIVCADGSRQITYREAGR